MNPFEKRATEYLREEEAFLDIVSPEPLVTFFKGPGEQGKLYDRLVIIVGTPGSGKTTLAQLFQYRTIRALVNSPSLSNYRDLEDSLTSCGAMKDGQAALVGCRLPLESEYRDIWELPYPDDFKSSLLITLLHARTMLGWLRALKPSSPAERVTLVPRADAVAALDTIGGTCFETLLERARGVEESVYRVTAALVAPPVESTSLKSIAAYRPLDVVEAFRVESDKINQTLKPLVIFDDAHSLHPQQLLALRNWLARRELRVARWILMRFDALRPDYALGCPDLTLSEDGSGLDVSRELTEIRLQGQDDRKLARKAFRKMAKDMANRYLCQMEAFARRKLHNFEPLLSATPPSDFGAQDLEALREHVDRLQHKLGVAIPEASDIRKKVTKYLTSTRHPDTAEEVGLVMESILLHRHGKRTPQLSLFEDPSEVDAEVNDEGEGEDTTETPGVNSTVADAARIHLLHKYNRPYYYGLNTLCDASSDNAEQFLRLSAALVSRLEAQMIRRKGNVLSSKVQNELLRQRAAEMASDWEFPQHVVVKRLASAIAARCLKRTLEPNASLGGGASAFGILKDDFELIPQRYPDLARVIQFGVAYNVFTLVPDHGTKKKIWNLLELGGVLLVQHGLTLHRGGFIESTPSELVRMMHAE